MRHQAPPTAGLFYYCHRINTDRGGNFGIDKANGVMYE
jgi:hypothetical protein